MVFLREEGSDAEIVIPRAAIQSAEATRKCLMKRAIVTLTDGQRFVFDGHRHSVASGSHDAQGWRHVFDHQRPDGHTGGALAYRRWCSDPLGRSIGQSGGHANRIALPQPRKQASDRTFKGSRANNFPGKLPAGGFNTRSDISSDARPPPPLLPGRSDVDTPEKHPRGVAHPGKNIEDFSRLPRPSLAQ